MGYPNYPSRSPCKDKNSEETEDCGKFKDLILAARKNAESVFSMEDERLDFYLSECILLLASFVQQKLDLENKIDETVLNKLMQRARKVTGKENPFAHCDHETAKHFKSDLKRQILAMLSAFVGWVAVSDEKRTDKLRDLHSQDSGTIARILEHSP